MLLAILAVWKDWVLLKIEKRLSVKCKNHYIPLPFFSLGGCRYVGRRAPTRPPPQPPLATTRLYSSLSEAARERDPAARGLQSGFLT